MRKAMRKTLDYVFVRIEININIFLEVFNFCRYVSCLFLNTNFTFTIILKILLNKNFRGTVTIVQQNQLKIDSKHTISIKYLLTLINKTANEVSSTSLGL